MVKKKKPHNIKFTIFTIFQDPFRSGEHIQIVAPHPSFGHYPELSLEGTEASFIVTRLLPGIWLLSAENAVGVERKCRRFPFHHKCIQSIALISYLNILLTPWIKAGRFLSPGALGQAVAWALFQGTCLTWRTDLHVVITQPELGPPVRWRHQRTPSLRMEGACPCGACFDFWKKCLEETSYIMWVSSSVKRE